MPDISTLLGNMNIVDYAVLALLLLSGIMATTRGLMRELLGIMGWVLAVMVATLLRPQLSRMIESATGHEPSAVILGFALPFLVTALVFFLLANAIAPALRSITFGRLDTILGFVFGVMRGMVLATLCYLGAVLVYGGERDLPAMVKNSASIGVARSMAQVATGFATGDFRIDLEDAVPGAKPRPQGNLLDDERISGSDVDS